MGSEILLAGLWITILFGVVLVAFPIGLAVLTNKKGSKWSLFFMTLAFVGIAFTVWMNGVAIHQIKEKYHNTETCQLAGGSYDAKNKICFDNVINLEK